VDCWQAGGGKLSLAITGTESPYFFSVLGKSAQSGATISGIPVGTYMAQIRNGNNCLIDSVPVTINAITIPGVVCDTVYVPTGFTPNQDGKNDVLRPFVNNLVARFEFRIYNRYGELIFETSTPGKGWNGRWKGLDQPPGTYVWMLTYDMNNRKRVFKGTTVLLR
jgi:gliding motility-associated-like protein